MYSLSTDTVKSGALASTLLCAEAMGAMHQTRASQVPSNTYTFHQAMILKIINHSWAPLLVSIGSGGSVECHSSN
jgi:hypothetical protein